MRGLVITGLVFLALMSLVVVVHASSWFISSTNLNTTRAVVAYNITNGTLRGEVVFINYTAFMLQTIEFNLKHHIPLNKTQLFYLTLLQALSTQGSNTPSIVSVSVVSTGPQPLGPYESYDVVLVNATLSGTVQSLTFYSLRAGWMANGSAYEAPLYLIALPGTNFAYGYIIFEETASVCYATFYYYEYYPIGVGVVGYYTASPCTSSILHVTEGISIFYPEGTLYVYFTPYQGTSMNYPQYPNTINLTISAQPGSIGIYNIPIDTPLSTCWAWGLALGTSCIYEPILNIYGMIEPTYMSPVVYQNMPVIVLYPTQPGTYTMQNMLVMPPGGPVPIIRYLLIQASVSGPSVVQRQLFSVSVPYGSCGYANINPAPLQLSSYANYGFLAIVSGWYSTSTAYAGFQGWASGYDTSTPGFNTAVLAVCDYRGFWSLTPTTINITLYDEYGYPIGYGLITLEPNYYAWLIIGLAVILIITVIALVGSVYGWLGITRKEKGEVVIRL